VRTGSAGRTEQPATVLSVEDSKTSTLILIHEININLQSGISHQGGNKDWCMHRLQYVCFQDVTIYLHSKGGRQKKKEIREMIAPTSTSTTLLIFNPFEMHNIFSIFRREKKNPKIFQSLFSI